MHDKYIKHSSEKTKKEFRKIENKGSLLNQKNE